MAYRLEFSVEAERDFGLMFDQLVDSCLGFGEALEDAPDHSEARILEIRATADRIAAAPHRGERHDNVLLGLRHLVIGPAVYWFDVDDDRQTVRVLAIVFGGQDHIRHMMVRLLGETVFLLTCQLPVKPRKGCRTRTSPHAIALNRGRIRSRNPANPTSIVDRSRGLG